jgi:amino acid permease
MSATARKDATQWAPAVSDSALETGPDKTQADQVLETLGYTPELSRNRSTWNVVFMSFILASVPYGLSTTYFYALAGGGPTNIIWGWVLVSLIILCVAASLAEITSVFPTAGGVYYQTFVLSPIWCRRISSWVCGWAYVAGQIMITLAVNFGTTQFFIACLNVFEDSNGVGITESWEAWHTYVIFLAVTLVCHAIPAFANKWLPLLEVDLTRCAFYLASLKVYLLITSKVFCHFLDPGWCNRYRHLPAGHCQERPPKRQVGVWPL